MGEWSAKSLLFMCVWQKVLIIRLGRGQPAHTLYNPKEITSGEQIIRGEKWEGIAHNHWLMSWMARQMCEQMCLGFYFAIFFGIFEEIWNAWKYYGSFP